MFTLCIELHFIVYGNHCRKFAPKVQPAGDTRKASCIVGCDHFAPISVFANSANDFLARATLQAIFTRHILSIYPGVASQREREKERKRRN